jgi:hypothetical protein
VPEILEDNLMNMMNFSDSRNKLERIWKGEAIRDDLEGDTPKEKTRSEMLYMNDYIFKRK